LEDSDEPILLAALAYQAGRAQRAFDLARLAALQGSERGRPSDALRANHIALLTVDPDWAKFDKRSAYWVDLAVQAAPPCRCSFVGWRQRDEVALGILRDNLRSLGTVSAGSSALSDAILSEARMLSQRLGDHEGGASLIAMEGRLLFERDDVVGAKNLHENAERMFAAHGPERSTDRADNLVRLAICLRQMGRRDASIKTLRQALKHRLNTDWTLLNKVRSNMGAAYLLTDWSMVRYHWDRQLRSARVHGLASREAHALASLSFINLFDGQQSDGRRQAEDAMEIAKSQGMDNTLLRCDLNLSIASLMDGNPDAALHFLSEAEAIAVQHQIGRRLWRVYANLATTHELLGDREKTRARDLQTIVSLKANTWEGGMLLQRGRALLPLINIAFRAIDTPELYTQVLDRLQTEVVFILSEVAGQLITGGPCSLNQILLKYLVDLRGARRFLLAE
jgi:tetratricopeptide (TPR) repeat protein